MRFFAGAGEATRLNWQRSCATFNASAGNVGEACVAAGAAFDVMAQWLTEVPVREITAA